MTLDEWYAELLTQMDSAIDAIMIAAGWNGQLDTNQRQNARSVLCEFTVKYDIVREKYLAD